MQASIDLSLYPLSADYVPVILDFIHRMQAREGIEVLRNPLSTQIFGELTTLMQALTEELQHSWETHGRAVLVSKMVLGDVRTGA